MITIPVADLNDSLSEVTLDGVVYGLHLGWNDTGGYWSYGLEDAAGNTLVDGMTIVPDYPLFERLRTPDFPPGILLAVTPDGRNTISYDDLVSGLVELIYMEQQDVEDAQA